MLANCPLPPNEHELQIKQKAALIDPAAKYRGVMIYYVPENKYWLNIFQPAPVFVGSGVWFVHTNKEYIATVAHLFHVKYKKSRYVACFIEPNAEKRFMPIDTPLLPTQKMIHEDLMIAHVGSQTSKVVIASFYTKSPKMDYEPMKAIILEINSLQVLGIDSVSVHSVVTGTTATIIGSTRNYDYPDEPPNFCINETAFPGESGSGYVDPSNRLYLRRSSEIIVGPFNVQALIESAQKH
jgi:hypothetical protein